MTDPGPSTANDQPVAKPITKLLIANRGEVAARIIRSARQLDVATVAVYADPDAGAPYVAQADEAVRLPGVAPTDTYLRVDRLLAAAERTGADAVHPGYGFLSERAEFARACAAAGLVFVGPSPGAIEAMGSKTAAKELMAAAGVPVLPSVIVGDVDALDDDVVARAQGVVGFPLLVKASLGGGGRGMRVVREPGELAEAVAAGRREATAAFGDGTVFLEHYVDAPRHVEVQIFGDHHGTLVHLFERECSIQRRYQKVLEEAPSPAVDPELRARLGTAAVAAGRAIDYVGAGTVEFVLDAERNFSFLEVNTRLQVEHPVTELVTGLDLVCLQLLVAEGRPLPDEARRASLSGHAVEARLYAEDPAAGFLPATGRLQRFAVPAGPGVRVDAGVADGSEVTVNYDPLLAKVIAHGPTRQEACRRLAAALDRAQLHGVTTNRDLLVGILREAEFRAGRIDTGYLARHDPLALMGARHHPRAGLLHTLAAALAAQAERRRQAPVLASLPSGWRNVTNGPQVARFVVEGEPVEVGYRFARWGPPGSLEAAIDGKAVEAVLHGARADGVDLEVAGVRRRLAVHRVGDVSYVDSALGSSVVVEEPRFPEPEVLVVPGSLVAPMPGTVVRLGVEPGQQVAAGQWVAVLEAMKMEHTVAAPHDGKVVEVRVSAGQPVDVGTVLAVVEASG